MIRYIFAAAFTVAATCSTLQAQETRFHNIWQAGDGNSRHTGLLPLSQFLDAGAQLVDDGLRLIDVETANIQGRRMYTGLFTQGTGGNFLDVVRGRSAFEARMRARAAQNLRVHDIEVFGRAPNRTFVAVFGPGSRRQLVTRPLSFVNFLERKELLRTRGLQLADVEVLRINGRLRYLGVFRSDVPPAVITGARSRSNFTDLRDRMVADGWELFDMERQVNASGNDVYFGLWRQGDGASRISLLRPLLAQLAFAEDQRQAGQRATDLEIKHTPAAAPSQPEPPVEPDPGPDPEPPVPPLPDYLTVAAGSGDGLLRLQFSRDSDAPFHLEFPAAWLPDDAINNEGEIVLPEEFCRLTVRLSDAFFWQIPSDPAVDTGFFNSLPEVPQEFFLGGVSFEGPIGGCADTQTPWTFDFPLTNGTAPFEPLPNMSLVIGAVSGQIEFE